MKNSTAYILGIATILALTGAVFLTEAAVGQGSTVLTSITRGTVTTQVMSNPDGTYSLCTSAPATRMTEYALWGSQYLSTSYVQYLRTLPSCSEEQAPDWHTCDTSINRARFLAWNDAGYHTNEYSRLYKWDYARNAPSHDLGE